jgi:hypothetical protein
MIAERKGRTTNHGKWAIEMALQRIASVAKILRKGAIVMLCGRSQRNENLQGDECILQQISALRRENRFLKFGLIFCLVLSALPYLTGFQPKTISAKRVVTEEVEFVKDEKTVMSITTGRKGYALVILDKGVSPAVMFFKDTNGGVVGVLNNANKLVAAMGTQPSGGMIAVASENGKPAASILAQPMGGSIGVDNKDGRTVAAMHALPTGGAVGVRNNDGKTVAVIGVSGEDGKIEVYNNNRKLIWSAP